MKNPVPYQQIATAAQDDASALTWSHFDGRSGVLARHPVLLVRWDQSFGA
jgi:hypothetical protein